MGINFDEERERIVQRALKSPRPCMVCSARLVVGIGTWVPDETQRLAAGGNDEITPIFAFWLCALHVDATPENDKHIRQAILRSVRTGDADKV
jgi:hypothetical protein